MVAELETLDILYQDNTLVVIHKPAGLLVHKSPIDKHEKRYAMRILRDQLGQWVYPVHRLDKATSGALLFALSSPQAQQLSAQFEAREVKKHYLALVRGHTAESITVDHALKDIAAFKDQGLKNPEPREAITTFKTLRHYELPFSDGRFNTSRYSLIEAAPITGRKHQIRRHLKHVSHPIVGDVKYGKGPHNRLFRDQFSCHRLLLAATTISFTHPETKKELTISCPLDHQFSQLQDQLAEHAIYD